MPGQAELGEDDVTSTSDLSLPEEVACRQAFERMVRDLGLETVDLMAPMVPPRAAAASAHDLRSRFPLERRRSRRGRGNDCCGDKVVGVPALAGFPTWYARAWVSVPRACKALRAASIHAC